MTNFLLTLVFGVLAWELIALFTGGIGFVSLTDLLPSFTLILADPLFLESLFYTVGLTLAGLLAGTVVALVLGLPLGLSRFLDQSTRGTLNFARAIPTVVLLPLLLASLDSRTQVVVTLVIFGVSIKMVIYVTRGVKDFPKSLSDQAAVMKVPLRLRIAKIYLPGSSAFVVAGIRQSVGRAYGGVILAGFLAGTPGLGRDINFANLRGDDAALLAFVVIAGLVAVLIYQGLLAIERRVVKWRVAG